MNLTDARVTIAAALERMNALYHQRVFDEWVLVKLAREQGVLLSYDGPRAHGYQARFKSDIAPLRTEIDRHALAVGDFEFIPDADGTLFDACIRLGPAGYLFCNHTTKSMNDIRGDPRWLEAQKPFVDLSAAFRADPLE